MAVGKTQLLDRHRWIPPLAILASIGIAWLLDGWMLGLIVRFRVSMTPYGERLLLQIVLTMILLVLLWMAARSPQRKALGAILLGIGLASWVLTLLADRGAIMWILDRFDSPSMRQTLVSYSTSLTDHMVSWNLARSALWLGVLLVTSSSWRERWFSTGYDSSRALLSSMILLILLLTAYAVTVLVLPQRLLSMNQDAWWLLRHWYVLGAFVNSGILAGVWLRAMSGFEQRWAATAQWIALGLVGSAAFVVLGIHHGVYRLSRFWQTVFLDERTYDVVAQILMIGVLGFLSASWRRARISRDVSPAAPAKTSP